jgi:hypothetical protein
MIMKTKSIILISCILVMSLQECTKFEDINTNPDVSTVGDASMLLTGIELSFRPSNSKSFMYPFLLQKQLAWCEGAISDYQYNKLTRIDYSVYEVLTNIRKMEEAATNSGYTGNMYKAVGMFIRTYKLFNLSMQVGDIPYTQAVQGESGIYQPTYDSQRDIMISILNDLDEASTLIAASVSNNEVLAGDFFYAGDPSKWLKLVNSFKLYVLINLAKKESDVDLNIVNRFKAIVDDPANYPVMTSNDDNFQVVYRDKEGEKKPFYADGFEVYAVTSSFVVDKLKSLNDYRLFYYADPLDGQAENDFNSYAGLDPSAPNETNLGEWASGNASILNKLYYDPAYPQGFPYVILGYGDVQFMLAEAAVRGWIAGEETYYKNGISASMQFRMNNIDPAWVHGMALTDSYISSYLEQPEVQLPADADGKLRQIMWQKYLGSLFQNDWNVFFDYRRTGYPEFPINPATNKNELTDRMPVRWLYPDAEYNYNQENIQNAVNSQYGGKDDENQTMWMLE